MAIKVYVWLSRRLTYTRTRSRSSACSLLTLDTSAPVYSALQTHNHAKTALMSCWYQLLSGRSVGMMATVSVYSQRKRQRQIKFVAGRSRAVYKRPIPLPHNETNYHTEVGPTPQQTAREANCHRGCPAILCGLAGAFMAMGRHPAKALRNRVISYPQPKKQRLAYRNVSGTPLTQSWICLLVWPCLGVGLAQSHTRTMHT